MLRYSEASSPLPARSFGVPQDDRGAELECFLIWIWSGEDLLRRRLEPVRGPRDSRGGEPAGLRAANHVALRPDVVVEPARIQLDGVGRLVVAHLRGPIVRMKIAVREN